MFESTYLPAPAVIKEMADAITGILHDRGPDAVVSDDDLHRLGFTRRQVSAYRSDAMAMAVRQSHPDHTGASA